MRSGMTLVAVLAGIASVSAVDLPELWIRPLRPLTSEVRFACVRPSLSEIKEAVAAMQEIKRAIQAERGVTRSEVRQELRGIRETRIAMRRELNDSIEDAKTLALENVRKLSEEKREKGRGREL